MMTRPAKEPPQSMEQPLPRRSLVKVSIPLVLPLLAGISIFTHFWLDTDGTKAFAILMILLTGLWFSLATGTEVSRSTNSQLTQGRRLMTTSLSITATASLDELTAPDVDGNIRKGSEVDSAWGWLLSRASLTGKDSLLLELPTTELLSAKRSDAMIERDEIEARFMETWTPPEIIDDAVSRFIRAGVAHLIVDRQ